MYVQPYPAPVAPVVLQSDPPTKADGSALDGHLTAWEKKKASVMSLRAEVAFTRTDAAFKKGTTFTGVVVCLKPNYTALRLVNAGDPTGTDAEAYLCDGKTVYVHNEARKTVTDVGLPPKWPFRWLGAGTNPALALLTGLTAAELKERFEVGLLKTDDHYVYLDIRPRSDRDRREFQHLRLALYGPGRATAKFAYLPAQVYILRPSGDAEVWKFTNPQVDSPDIDAKAFDFKALKGWKVQTAPPLPAELEHWLSGKP